MKAKKLYMAFVWLAVIMLLAVSHFPHHHHGSELCTIVEHCEADDADNDKHTMHGGDSQTFCAVNAGLMVSSDTAVKKPCHKPSPAKQPLAAVPAACAAKRQCQPCVTLMHAPLAQPAQSPATGCRPLRAPPSCTEKKCVRHAA